MKQTLRAVRGMNDVLPPQTFHWQWLEQTIATVLAGYGYREIRLPLVELTPVFARSIGEVTDIVQKEMYTFADRNGDSLTLRPEGTASCVRAVLEHGLLHQQAQRLWYRGAMFRHERPQKGRYRQFHQIGVEAFGYPGPDIDAELILMTARLWRALGLAALRLEINTLGTSEERRVYRDALTAYFAQHRDRLDGESAARLARNPLRILDSKNPEMKALITGAPVLADYLGEESKAHFDGLRALLDAAAVSYVVNPHLVRGLDYYAKTVFEWITDELGAQGTVCAGGRYDGLVELMGGDPTPAIGFALGIERLLELLGANAGGGAAEADCYLIPTAPELLGPAQSIAERLRDALPDLRIVCHCGGGSLKSQLKKADRTGAAAALILGPDEHAAQEITVKPLRGEAAQRRVPIAELPAFAAGLFGR